VYEVCEACILDAWDVIICFNSGGLVRGEGVVLCVWTWWFGGGDGDGDGDGDPVYRFCIEVEGEVEVTRDQKWKGS
jgi:hypothetical protein